MESQYLSSYLKFALGIPRSQAERLYREAKRLIDELLIEDPPINVKPVINIDGLMKHLKLIDPQFSLDELKKLLMEVGGSGYYIINPAYTALDDFEKSEVKLDVEAYLHTLHFTALLSNPLDQAYKLPANLLVNVKSREGSLNLLKWLLDQGRITEDEYNKISKRLLAKREALPRESILEKNELDIKAEREEARTRKSIVTKSVSINTEEATQRIIEALPNPLFSLFIHVHALLSEAVDKSKLEKLMAELHEAHDILKMLRLKIVEADLRNEVEKIYENFKAGIRDKQNFRLNFMYPIAAKIALQISTLKAKIEDAEITILNAMDIINALTSIIKSNMSNMDMKKIESFLRKLQKIKLSNTRYLE
ncbi:MAG: hypothetical protein ACXQTB_01235 [Candidatus Nezhaarchaeales archaeon]